MIAELQDMYVWELLEAAIEEQSRRSFDTETPAGGRVRCGAKEGKEVEVFWG